MSEMFGYIGDLRSKTQGRAMFTMQMDSYAEVPKNVSEEIIKAEQQKPIMVMPEDPLFQADR